MRETLITVRAGLAVVVGAVLSMSVDPVPGPGIRT